MSSLSPQNILQVLIETLVLIESRKPQNKEGDHTHLAHEKTAEIGSKKITSEPTGYMHVYITYVGLD